jgi:uncharacterized protein (DUF885 family)
MALSLEAWNNLSVQEKDQVINFLRGNCKIDLEYPEGSANQSNGGYQITDGITTGGNPMKYGEEYRIYIDNIRDIPPFLDAELKERGTKNRIGGSKAIKAIMQYGNLRIGRN